MHWHKYEKIWLVFGTLSLIVFLSIVGVTAFRTDIHLLVGWIRLTLKRCMKQHHLTTRVSHKLMKIRMKLSSSVWHFGYTPPKLRVPVGKEIIFTLTSTDVVHSFTIDDTKVNMMAVPGRITHKSYTFNKPGNYLVLCNEYCGAGHHFMQTEIEVYEP